MKSYLEIFFITFTVYIFSAKFVFADTIAEYLCESQPSNTRLPHPELCEVYLVCKDNQAKEMKCPTGVMFNPKTNECDPNFKDCPASLVLGRDEYDEDGNEGDDGDGDEEGDEAEENEEADEENGDNNTDNELPAKDKDEESKTNPGKPQAFPNDDTVCPRTDTDQVTFVMNKIDCSKYYLCYHGKPIPFECSMGMHWSNKQKKCVPKEVSECGTISQSSDGGCPERGIKFMPHPNVCQYFVFCLNGAETVQRCEAFYHWDVNEGRCKLKTMATCYHNLRQALDSKSIASTNRDAKKKS